MDLAAKVETAAAPPPTAPRTGEHDRTQTQVALAMFEALTAIDRRYESYLGLAKDDLKADQTAAAATAAYQVLLAHYPSQKAALDESYAMSIDSVANAAARDSGQRIGNAAAALALKAGLVDPAVTQIPYAPRAPTGVRVPTQLPIFPPPATKGEPGWEPLIATPNHPEYPCGHCIGDAATAKLMKAEYGNRPASGVRVASRSIPNAAVQVLPTWDKWAEEVSFSRTLGGVHYRFSNEVGEDMGRKVTRIALASYMRSLRK